jgi:hypothetical protein
MGDIPAPLGYLLLSWGVITGILVILVIYRATLSTREDDQIYISNAGDHMMADEQRELIEKMNRLGRPILMLSILSGVLLLASAGLWVWNGLKTF